MRDLSFNETTVVTGAGPTSPPTKGPKGNNGYGNGSDDPNLTAPGKSGSTPGNKNGSTVR